MSAGDQTSYSISLVPTLPIPAPPRATTIAIGLPIPFMMRRQWQTVGALSWGRCQILTNPKQEAFAQVLARGSSAGAAYVEAGYKENRHNAAILARKQHILTRVGELQYEQLAIHQQATAEAAASAKVTIESLIAEAEAARAKAMEEKGGAAAA